MLFQQYESGVFLIDESDDAATTAPMGSSDATATSSPTEYSPTPPMSARGRSPAAGHLSAQGLAVPTPGPSPLGGSLNDASVAVEAFQKALRAAHDNDGAEDPAHGPQRSPHPHTPDRTDGPALSSTWALSIGGGGGAAQVEQEQHALAVLDALQHEVDALRGTVGRLQQDRSDLAARCEEQADALDQLAAHAEGAARVIEGLQLAATSSARDLVVCRGERDELRDRVEDAEVRATDAELEAACLRSELSRAHADLASLKARHSAEADGVRASNPLALLYGSQ